MLIKDTPILILAFNRDKKFNSCLENIYKYGFRKIYISVDGPRNKEDKNKQKIINKICQDYSELISCDLKTNFIDKWHGKLKYFPTFVRKNEFIY